VGGVPVELPERALVEPGGLELLEVVARPGTGGALGGEHGDRGVVVGGPRPGLQDVLVVGGPGPVGRRVGRLAQCARDHRERVVVVGRGDGRARVVGDVAERLAGRAVGVGVGHEGRVGLREPVEVHALGDGVGDDDRGALEADGRHGHGAAAQRRVAHVGVVGVEVDERLDHVGVHVRVHRGQHRVLAEVVPGPPAVVVRVAVGGVDGPVHTPVGAVGAGGVGRGGQHPVEAGVEDLLQVPVGVAGGVGGDGDPAQRLLPVVVRVLADVLEGLAGQLGGLVLTGLGDADRRQGRGELHGLAGGHGEADDGAGVGARAVLGGAEGGPLAPGLHAGDRTVGDGVEVELVAVAVERAPDVAGQLGPAVVEHRHVERRAEPAAEVVGQVHDQ
jgi:hypothetical protein